MEIEAELCEDSSRQPTDELSEPYGLLREYQDKHVEAKECAKCKMWTLQ